MKIVPILALSAFLSISCVKAEDFINVHTIEEPDEKKADPSVPGNDTPGGSTFIPGGSDVPTQPKPELLSIASCSPNRGKADKINHISVIGSAFSKNTKIFFDNVEITQKYHITDKILNVLAPPMRSGCVGVKVVEGEKIAEKKDAFCFYSVPEIESIEPAIVATGRDVEITVKGKGFEPSIALTSDDMMIKEYKVVDRNLITAIAYAASPGLKSVAVAGKEGFGNHVGPTFANPLFLSSFYPGHRMTGKFKLYLTGDFPRFEHISVLVGTTPCKVISASVENIVVEVPELEEGLYQLVVSDRYSQTIRENAVRIYAPNSHYAEIAPKILIKDMDDAFTVQLSEIPADLSIRLNDRAVRFERTDEHTVKVSDIPSSGEYRINVSGNNLRLDDKIRVYDELAFESMIQDGENHIIKGEGFCDDLALFAGQTAIPFRIRDAGHILIDKKDLPEDTSVLLSAKGCGNQYAEYYRIVGGKSEVLGFGPNVLSVSGNTLMTVWGKGFDSSAEVRINDVKVENRVINSSVMTFTTPPAQVGMTNFKISKKGKEIFSGEVEYFDPSASYTGAYGSRIENNVHISVLESPGSEKLPDASVIVNGKIIGKSDANGQITFSSENLRGAVSVTACAPKHACVGLQPIDATYITLYLPKDPDDKQIIIPPVDPPPFDPSAINPIDITVIKEKKPPEITGNVTGADKIVLQLGQHQKRAILVTQSTSEPYSPLNNKEIAHTILWPKTDYRMTSGTGNLVMIAYCGVYDTVTKKFTPYKLALSPNLFIEKNNKYKVDLDCNIDLDSHEKIKINADNPDKDIEKYYANAFVYLGKSGYFGGFMSGESKDDLVVIPKLPSFEGVLADKKIVVRAGCIRKSGTDYFNTELYTPDINKIVSVGPVQAGPQLIQDDHFLRNALISWRVPPNQRYDFFTLSINAYTENTSKLLLRAYLPGNAQNIELPEIDLEQFAKSKNLTVSVYLNAYTSYLDFFDFNYFSTPALRWNNIRSVSADVMSVRLRQ